MNTNLAEELETQTDTSLVESSLSGDREAFGRIIARYQSPVCALAYSACGNFARSEDLAQEIFITAWRKLGSLQETERFKSWLYSIARNLIDNTFSQQTHNPVAHVEILDETSEPASPAIEPDQLAISKEEETILWYVLFGLPEVYREPMVLFHRQKESVSQVANVLAISEEAVRQRLSHGRALLNERVARVVQNGLRRSSPADTFAIGVIGALPLLAVATTAKGAVVATAMESTAGQATGLMGVFKNLGFFAGLIAIPATLGTFFGYKLGQDASGLQQQRKSAARFWKVFGGGLVLFLFVPLLLTFGVTGFLQGDARANFLSVMTVWLELAYPFVFAAPLFWAWQHHRKPSNAEPSTALRENETVSQCSELIRAVLFRNISGRLVLFLTITAAALLIFCYFDMRHNVIHLSSGEAHDLIRYSAPGELRASISVSHYRSLFHESPETCRTFLFQVNRDGTKATSCAPVDETAVTMLAQKGIACPIYIEGRDFEVLGAPGRFLPFLAAFVLGIGVVFLIKRSRVVKSTGK